MREMIVCLVLAFAAGCVPVEDRAAVVIDHAAQALGCAKTELSTRYLGSRLFRVSGCGKRASYRVICKLTAGSCYALDAS